MWVPSSAGDRATLVYRTGSVRRSPGPGVAEYLQVAVVRGILHAAAAVELGILGKRRGDARQPRRDREQRLVGVGREVGRDERSGCAPGAQRRRVGAGDVECGVDADVVGAVRRRETSREGMVGDHTAGLRRAGAERDVLEGASQELALRHPDVAADEQPGDQATPHRRRRIEVALHQARGHERALRVAHDDHVVPVVLVPQVEAPGVEDVLVRDVEEVLRVRRADGRERGLPVVGRETRQRVLNRAACASNGSRVRLT